MAIRSEYIVNAVDLLALASLLLAVAVEVEPVSLCISVILLNCELSPTSLSMTVIPTVEVVGCCLPTKIIIIVLSMIVSYSPAIKHVAFLIEAILKAIDGLNLALGKLAVSIGGVSLSVAAEIVPPVLSVKLCIVIVAHSYGLPGVLYHCAVLINIIILGLAS